MMEAARLRIRLALVKGLCGAISQSIGKGGIIDMKFGL